MCRTYLITMIIAVLALASSSWGQQPRPDTTVTTIRCSEPHGVRLQHEHGKATPSDDGFTGVNPIFIYDRKSPETMLVMWGAAQVLGYNEPPNATRAKVLEMSPDRIVATERDGTAHWLYAIYWRTGVGFALKHGSGGLLTAPYGSVFYMRCSVVGR